MVGEPPYRKEWLEPSDTRRSAERSQADRELLVMTDDVVTSHLEGEIELGMYPLLRDDRCAFLACDFDGASWMLDALALHDARGHLEFQLLSSVPDQAKAHTCGSSLPSRFLPRTASDRVPPAA